MSIAFSAAMSFLAPVIASAVAGGLERGSRLDTTFGHVRVDSASVRSAIEEGEAARLAAKKVLGLRAPRFSIVEQNYTSHKWGDRSPDGSSIYVWPFENGPDGRRQSPPAYVLRHEIGHDLFIRYLVPSTKGGQYGGDAPDWLDEMAAVAFEGEAQRLSRRRGAVLYAREGKLIPLTEFLAMTHPEMAAGPIPGASDRSATAFEPVSDVTPSFYATASAFYEFLVVRTKNPAIVAEAAAAFRKGELLDRWLAARTGQSRGIEALDADFRAWVGKDPRYGASGNSE